MPSKINKMIKKIKTMKIFKKKNKSYENDTQEDIVFTTGFGTKERIESMNSSMVNNMNGLKEKASVGRGCGYRRDLDYVKTSAMNSVDINDMNVDGIKEKASVGIDSLKTSAMNSVDVNDMNVDGLKEKDSVGIDSLKTSAMNSVDVNDMNCLLYTSPSPRDGLLTRMPSSA